MKQAARKQQIDLGGKRIAVICARFYPELADMLLQGARAALRECNLPADDVSVFDVPGCFELPLAAARVISSTRFDAVVALGAVIRGQTPHFDYVAAECARGLMQVQLETGCPIGFGVLTTDTYAQAEERADPQRGNKGYAAAMAAASLLQIPA
ncbi:MAG: 6,7-dimethyl-8-ribityllumazine synthase [Candidatus Eremiobacteraeota bacterium]|nr:6,7-dimethyl-8-ribityllumazine synthase [Candidatus Eremiobacteraeota bacterium]